MKYLVRIYENKDKDPTKFQERILNTREEIYSLLRIKNSTFSKFMNGEIDMDKTQFPWLRQVEITRIKDDDLRTANQKKKEKIFQDILEDFKKLEWYHFTLINIILLN